MIAQEYAEIEAKFATEAQKAGVLDEWIKMFYAPRMAYRIVLGMGELYSFPHLASANKCQAFKCFSSSQEPTISSTT